MLLASTSLDHLVRCDASPRTGGGEFLSLGSMGAPTFEKVDMKNNPKRSALVPIVLGLVGMAAYQIILHFDHPIIMNEDLFHGIWFGICFGLEITGLYLISKNKGGSAA